jgi:hypothetical protein
VLEHFSSVFRISPSPYSPRSTDGINLNIRSLLSLFKRYNPERSLNSTYNFKPKAMVLGTTAVCSSLNVVKGLQKYIPTEHTRFPGEFYGIFHASLP